MDLYNSNRKYVFLLVINANIQFIVDFYKDFNG